jgi:tRNA dimethylallyltransferase
VGKTALSLELARQFPLEIVSADSRLFYRGMDIGTAKPSLAERTAVPHHLIDICSPAETITLGAYQRLAYAAIHDIQARGRLPLLVGGSGQYVRAVVEGWGIPELPPQPALRAALERLDGDELARWLAGLDPEAAQRIDRRNVRRVIRALEVTLVKGRPISELQRKRPPGYPILQIGLDCDRDALYGRIDQRVDGMMAAGLLAEVAHLVSLGYGRDCPPLSGLGYRQLLDYLAGESSLTEAVERIKFETHRFVRQQYTWFRRDDPALHWFANGDITGVTDLLRRWLAPMVTQ